MHLLLKSTPLNSLGKGEPDCIRTKAADQTSFLNNRVISNPFHTEL